MTSDLVLEPATTIENSRFIRLFLETTIIEIFFEAKCSQEFLDIVKKHKTCSIVNSAEADALEMDNCQLLLSQTFQNKSLLQHIQIITI